MADILNPRRVPRIPLRCTVDVRHRFSTWAAETEDVGPGGCQLVSPRPVEPGREVKLVIRCDALGRTVDARGTVVWTRPEAPVRLGIAFAPGAGAAWFDSLVASDPAAARAARSVPDRLPRQTRVYLGRPPLLVLDFSKTELELLRRIGAGVTLDALARSYGPDLDERTAGALFSLLGRRLVVLDREQAVGVGRWKGLLPEPAPAAERAAEPQRPAEAQRLYDEAMVHIGAGRLGLAVDRLRDAQRLAPGDAEIAATLARIGRWT